MGIENILTEDSAEVYQQKLCKLHKEILKYLRM